MSQESMIVLTCGNSMAGDDGLGPRVARTLDRLAGRGISIPHTPLSPGAIVSRGPGHDQVLVVDAAIADHASPGEIIEIDSPTTEDALLPNALASSHGWSVAAELALADELHALPSHVRLLAVVVGDFAEGGTMSTAVRKAATRVCRRILSLRYPAVAGISPAPQDPVAFRSR